MHLDSFKGITYLTLMIDRKLGYAIVCLIFLIGSAVLVYMLKPVFFPPETRIIAFDTIGNLRIDDPVRVKGILSGIDKKNHMAEG